MVWNDEFTQVATFDGTEVSWSPVKNGLLINRCHLFSIEDIHPEALFYAEASNFEATNITPLDYRCKHSAYFSWNPNGTRLLLLGSDPEDVYNFDQIWVFETDHFYGRHLNPEIKFVTLPAGWMNNNNVVLSSHCGTGCTFTLIVDMHTEQKIASGYVNTIEKTTENYIGLTFGGGTNYLDAGFMSTEVQEDYVPGYESGPYVGFLRLGEPKPDQYQNSNNSSFQDWLPQTNKMLVMVGERGVMEDDEEFYNLPPMSDLQLWDVATDELTLLVPDGLYGRFSPNGRYLASVIPSKAGPTMQLRQEPFDQILLEMPTLAVGHSWSSFLPFFSFSPDSHYLAFFLTADSSQSAPTNLAVLDLENNINLWSLPAPSGDLFWSPDGIHLLYRAYDGNLTLLNVANGRTTPLTFDGGQLVRDPQWSHDGRYLSVLVDKENCFCETAVLAVPTE